LGTYDKDVAQEISKKILEIRKNGYKEPAEYLKIKEEYKRFQHLPIWQIRKLNKTVE
jgi:hypothetical protein